LSIMDSLYDPMSFLHRDESSRFEIQYSKLSETSQVTMLNETLKLSIMDSLYDPVSF
jgi:hypothetical protein